MTGLLFFSGTYLLDLVALSDTFYDSGLVADAALDEEGEVAADLTNGSDFRVGLPGFSFFQPFASGASNEFVEVLRGFKQETGEPINVLVTASADDGNTDSIMVARFNPTTSQISIISIPRDTYITLKGYTFHKINSVFKVKNGPEQLKALVSGILGHKIDYYVHVEMKTVREIVDLLDGVDYNVPCEMIYHDPDQNLSINLKKGLRTLTGKQVEGLLRFRQPDKWTKEVRQFYDGSDLKRIERQHDFFNEMLKQKLNIKYASKLGDIVDNIYSNIKTDLPLPEMLKLARALPALSSEALQTATLPGDAKYIDKISYYVHSPNQSKALADALLGGD